MASNSRSKREQNFSAVDRGRIRYAVEEIAASPNLRYFIRSVLGNAGLFELIPSDNALLMARFAGRHELGHSILATLNQVDPTLYPTLLLEEHREISERTQPRVERPDGGSPSGNGTGSGDDRTIGSPEYD